MGLLISTLILFLIVLNLSQCILKLNFLNIALLKPLSRINCLIEAFIHGIFLVLTSFLKIGRVYQVPRGRKTSRLTSYHFDH